MIGRYWFWVKRPVWLHVTSPYYAIYQTLYYSMSSLWHVVHLTKISNCVGSNIMLSVFLHALILNTDTEPFSKLSLDCCFFKASHHTIYPSLRKNLANYSSIYTMCFRSKHLSLTYREQFWLFPRRFISRQVPGPEWLRETFPLSIGVVLHRPGEKG